MAFKGDLRNLSLSDVLQTLGQNRQRGLLVLQKGEITRKIYITPEGIFLARSFRPMRLGEIFLRRGYLTPQDVEILLLEQKETKRPIGELMVESGKVPKEEVDQLLRHHAEDEIFEIFTWTSGSFAFFESDPYTEVPSKGMAEIKLDPSSLCIEAARRMDEMERLRAVVPSNHEFYVQVEGDEPDREQYGPQVCAVYDTLGVPTSVDELRDLVGISLFDVLAAVAQLVDGGVIRRLERAELIESGRCAFEQGDYRRAAEMFEQAHIAQPEDREALEECIAAVERLADPRRLARLLCALGQLCAATGHQDEAVEHLEHAVRQDPENVFILGCLRNALTQTGDLERAAETSLNLVRTLVQVGDHDQAIDACRAGLDIAPEHVLLRYLLGQTLAQADRSREAQQELYALARETEAAAKTRRSRRAQELLISCYRLLLKIDPRDEQAHEGMRRATRLRLAEQRKRKFVVRGAVVAGVLLIAGGVALVPGGDGPGELYSRLEQARQAQQTDRIFELVGRLVEEFPESEEAQAAMALRSSMRREQSDALKAKREQEKTLRETIETELDDVRTALRDRSYGEALGFVRPLLDRLQQRQFTFLRKEVTAHLEYDVTEFLERVRDRFDKDRMLVAQIENRLRLNAEAWEDSLPTFEKDLAQIRSRRWAEALPEIDALLTEISGAKIVGKLPQAVAAYRKSMEGRGSAFVNLDALYFNVRCDRLEMEIDEAVALARSRGRDLLGECRFAEARVLYDTAYKKAQNVDLEEPRTHFLELLNKLERRRIRADMKRRRDEIDHVVETLAEIQRLLAADDPAGAFRLFRPLVAQHRLIRFETEYRMPYLVTSTPRGAEILVNGVKVGRAPVTIELEILGRTEVEARRKGFHAADARLVATDPTLTGELHLDLRKDLAWQREIDGLVEARPVVAGNRLLVSTSNANLLALDLETGETLWEAKTRLLDRVTASPVAAGEFAYLITLGGKLFRVRLEGGEIEGPPLALSGSVRKDCAYDGSVLYVATANHRLLAIRGTSIVYDQPLARSPATGVVFADGKLFIGTAEGEILVHDASDGSERMRLRAGSGTSFFGGLSTHKNLVLAGAEDGVLYAFDVDTGKLAWKYPTAGPVSTPPVSHGACLLLPARDGYVHGLTEQGSLKIRYELSGSSDATPALEGGFLYALDGTRILAFDVEHPGQGQAWWEHAFPDEYGSPRYVAAGGGAILVVTANSRVVAFPSDAR
jgi:outer membrane protein assembly factor BamB/tetratricopeptide (TPR) repeat protein